MLREMWNRLRRPIDMLPPDHSLTTGSTGMGKSTWEEYKMSRSFEFDRPFCYIDPKGDSYWRMVWWLGCHPEGRKYYERYKHRILFLNPITAGNNMLSFNAIEPVDQFTTAHVDTTALVANSLVSHVRKQSGMDVGEAVRMQNIMNASLATLIEGGHGQFTLAEVPHLFTPSYSYIHNKRVSEPINPFTASLLSGLNHYAARLFWTHQWSTWTADSRRDWTQSTLGRIFQQIFDTKALYTICSSQNSRLDFNKVVRDGYWLFVNIPSGILHDSTIILGNIIITKLFNASMQRHDGYDYRLILDEASYFNSGPLAEILATARAHRLWLTLIVQSIEQMERSVNGVINEKIKQEVRNNVRYVTAFHVEEDAPYLAKLMFPLRGDFVMGVRESGDEEYLPTTAEADYHQRKILGLRKRQMVVYDKHSPNPIVKKTPDFDLFGFNVEQASLFEQQHLAITGAPRAEIKREIDDRLERISRLFTKTPPTQSSQTPPVYGQTL